VLGRLRDCQPVPGLIQSTEYQQTHEASWVGAMASWAV
jgi:hypothetical protein